jgi:pimeloyl-ACP methyl ester carboxylesterase
MMRPEIADFADAIARSLRGLGLGRVPVYGTHTGATIAAELGRRHPDLVSGLVLDGYPVFTVEERDLHHSFYMKAFAPRWDGGHVVELWSRIRDQFDFFPWYLRSEASRLPAPKADLERHRAVLRDFLLSGVHYGTAYAASFRFDGHESLQGHRSSVRIMARPTDLLFHQMERLGALPPGCTLESVSADPDAWANAIADLFNAMPGDPAPPAPRDGLAFGLSGLLGVAGGRMLARGYGAADSQAIPILLLHDTPGSADELSDLAARLARRRRVVVPERPNHGRSPDTRPGAEVDETVSLLDQAMDFTTNGPFFVLGFGEGGQLARLIASRRPSRVRGVIDITQFPELPAAASWLPPRMDGADLVERWFACRDRTLFTSDGVRKQLSVGGDSEAVHRRFVAAILAAGADKTMATAVRTRRALTPTPAIPTLVIDDGASSGTRCKGPASIAIADQIEQHLATFC